VAANAYFRSIALGSPDWTKLADVPTVLQATVIADTLNANPINLRFRGGTPASWPPGAAASLESVDLSELEVQGGSGHKLLVAAYAPGDQPRGRTLVKMLPKAIPYLGAVEPPGGETGGQIG